MCTSARTFGALGPGARRPEATPRIDTAAACCVAALVTATAASNRLVRGGYPVEFAHHLVRGLHTQTWDTDNAGKPVEPTQRTLPSVRHLRSPSWWVARPLPDSKTTGTSRKRPAPRSDTFGHLHGASLGRSQIQELPKLVERTPPRSDLFDTLLTRR